ncbi:hypothetical protein SmJEL517_g03932 [Synchytrium microbalum]|uniref:Endonuclease/exonuclease/phosphatase domain-containing protein n=1 Tax=Synchytrium microbalum TaxID=1806994 RepID=A0A507C6D7_9FUNG|nr:uncharacterized protein SmJEL517_g03932 [Synchytrium microbalum]TPX33113.1 hypothetical protein SmJEL517_g03932 [Synchytrium microbalum]
MTSLWLDVPEALAPLKHTARHDSSLKFTLMTFNALAQTLIRRDRYPNCTKNALKLKTRMPLLVNVIEQHKPDIICLQEIDHDHFASNFGSTFTRLGYEWSFDRKTPKDGKDTAQYGLCVGWKSATFESKWQLILDFDSAEPPCQSKTDWQTGCIAQVAAFTTSNPSVGLIVSNQHSYWRPAAKFTKLHQAMVTLEGITDLKRQLEQVDESGIRWHGFMCGDFNVTPLEATYRGIRMHKPLTPEMMADLQLDAEEGAVDTIIKRRESLPRLDSCYSTYRAIVSKSPAPNIDHDEPEYTHWSEGFVGTLDYIFSVRDEELSVKVERLLRIVTLEELRAPIPNETIGSDHLPIMAELTLSRA